MSTELSVVGQWDSDQVDLLKRTICKGSTDDEFKLFLHVAKRSGLDPFARQIHAVKRWNAKAGRDEMAIQVGIDGFRLIADRTGKYAGSDDPVFDDEHSPSKATVTVYKMVNGVRCAFAASARWNEYFPGEKQGFMWKSKPCLMLSKCAECLALRKAFPAELSGVYGEEELGQSDTPPAESSPAPVVAPVAAIAPPVAAATTAPAKKTKRSVWLEIMSVAEQINLGDVERDQWACEVSKKETVAAMSLEDLGNFLAVLQKER